MTLAKIINQIINLMRGKKTFSKQVLDLIHRDWKEIDGLIKGEAPSQLKQALINADRSLDTVLKSLVRGESTGERLKNAQHLFHPHVYDTLWQSHKLRNKMVHESGFEITHFVLKHAVENIRRGLRELDIKI